MIDIALSALMAGTSAASAQPAGVPYEIVVLFERQEGERRYVRELNGTVPLSPGFQQTLTMGKSSGQPQFIAEIKVSETEIDVRTTLCRPESSPCDVLAEPRMIFDIGDPAGFRGATEDGLSYSVSFAPSGAKGD